MCEGRLHVSLALHVSQHIPTNYGAYYVRVALMSSAIFSQPTTLVPQGTGRLLDLHGREKHYGTHGTGNFHH